MNTIQGLTTADGVVIPPDYDAAGFASIRAGPVKNPRFDKLLRDGLEQGPHIKHSFAQRPLENPKRMNLCYINSVIQLLLVTKPLTTLLSFCGTIYLLSCSLGLQLISTAVFVRPNRSDFPVGLTPPTSDESK